MQYDRPMVLYQTILLQIIMNNAGQSYMWRSRSCKSPRKSKYHVVIRKIAFPNEQHFDHSELNQTQNTFDTYDYTGKGTT